MDTKGPIQQLREELSSAPLYRKPLLELLNEIDAQYMRLPVDKNGVPVRPGDTLYAGKREIPGSNVLGVCDTHVYIWHYTSRSRITGVPADEFTHVKPDPVESVLNEMLADAGCEFHSDGSCEMGLTSAQISMYAELVREVCNAG